MAPGNRFGFEAVLLERAASWPDHMALESLDAPLLQQIAKRDGVDFATALLYDRFTKSPRHLAFIRRIDSLRKAPQAREQPLINARTVIVPGAMYVERPDMGGDGRMIREVAETFGCRSSLVPLASLGSVSENAQRLTAWLEQQPDEKLILVSLSKGGAGLKLALGAPDAPRHFRNVIAWVNVCGPLNGSLMADWILSSRVRRWLFRFLYWMQRRDFAFVSELPHGETSILKRPPRLPSGMKMISLVGFPLDQQMTTPFSRFCHRTLSAWGPNDGTVLLSDLFQWPGEIYPVWGADHYFRPESRARELITAVFLYLAESFASRSTQRASPVELA